MTESEALRAIGLAPGAREMPQNACSGKPAKQGFSEHASQKLFLEATDRLAERAMGAVVRRIDAAIAVETQVESVVAIAADRRRRPKVAEVTDTVETAITVVTATRSRIPDGLI